MRWTLPWRTAHGAARAVPSGASTGAHEAVELRDGDKSRFGGKGVPEGGVQRAGRNCSGHCGNVRPRPARPGQSPQEPGRHAQQAEPGRKRNPGRVPGRGPRGRRIPGSAPLPASLPGRPGTAARAYVQHPERRQARPGLNGLPGVHGHTPGRPVVQPRIQSGRGDIPVAEGRADRPRVQRQRGRRRRLRSLAALQQGTLWNWCWRP